MDNNLILPPHLKQQIGRRSLRYAVQIKGANGQTIKCLICNVDAPGGATPQTIQRILQQKITSFISQSYTSTAGIRAIVVGRIDAEI